VNADLSSRLDADKSADSSSPGKLDGTPIARALSRPIVAPPMTDTDGVLAALVRQDASDNDVVMLHSALHGASAGRDAPLFEGLLDLVDRHIEQVVRHRNHLRRVAASTDVFVEVAGEGTPWTVFGCVKVGTLALVSVALLVVGSLSIGQILMASGIPGFEQGFRAYLFSIVNIGGAFILKNLASLLPSGPGRRRFAGFVNVFGLLFAVAWAALFVGTFGQMTSDPGEVIGDLLAADGNDDSATGQTLLFAGLLAEMFLAGGCWIEIERIVEGHRMSRRVPNPRHVAIEERITEWSGELAMAESFAGELRARLRAIEQGGAAYLARARNAYTLLRGGIRTHREHRSAQMSLGEDDANGPALPVNNGNSSGENHV
jgi:hypothetical protein